MIFHFLLSLYIVYSPFAISHFPVLSSLFLLVWTDEGSSLHCPGKQLEDNPRVLRAVGPREKETETRPLGSLPILFLPPHCPPHPPHPLLWLSTTANTDNSCVSHREPKRHAFFFKCSREKRSVLMEEKWESFTWRRRAWGKEECHCPPLPSS